MPSVVRSVLSSLAVACTLASLATIPTLAVQAQDGSSSQAVSTPVSDANPAANAVGDALNALQPTMASVNLALSSIDVHRWKVPNDIKDQTTADADSIQRDLNSSLPGLITQAQAATGAIAPSFAVFRNIDALYDVLLRVTETATLAGSQQEAAHLESARADLQTRRRQLGDALLTSATAQDANVTQLRTSLAAAASPSATAAPSTPKKVVVDDGPASSAKTAHKKKVAKPVPAAPPAPQQ